MVQPASIAIAGIHTDIGKTIASAVLCQALEADYWKPIQAGSLEHTDRMQVQQLQQNTRSKIHPEALQLQLAASPHTAAAAEQIDFNFRQLRLPETDNLLLIETAGGLLSPIDQQHTMADFIGHFHLPVLLVTRHYLGSINHTLLCIEVLRRRGLDLQAVVVNGPRNAASENFIQDHCSGVPFLYISEIPVLTADAVAAEALLLRPQVQRHLPEYCKPS